MSLMQGGPPPPPPPPPTEDVSNFAPNQPMWPKDFGGAFSVPSATPNMYPMPVPSNDIISSTDRPSGPATIYSGIEPLAALNSAGLRQHFQDTSMPGVANLIRPQNEQIGQAVMAPYMENSQQQRNLLHKMASSMEHHRG